MTTPIAIPEFTERQTARIWSKVARIGGPGTCLEWIAGDAEDGGSLIIDGHYYIGRRVIWTLVNGPLPDKAQVFNTCGNRRCVDPAHSELAQKQRKDPCVIDGCPETAWARGWCPKHYMRWQTHGGSGL